LYGEQLTSLRPVTPVKDGKALNKAGRLVLCGEWQGKPVKLYEAANVEHARFIQSVCAHRLLAGCFPRVQALHGRFVRVDWIDNRARSAPPAAVLADLLRRVHSVPVVDLSSAGFDYWHEHIRPRFVRAAQLLGIDSLAERVIAQVDIPWTTSPPFLMHPDLTPSNVVLDAQGNWEVIDNELLTVGGLPLFDICNAAYGAGAKGGQMVAEQYFAHQAGWEVTNQDLTVLNAAWLARAVGASFVGGQLSAAKTLVERYRSGQNILPIQLQAAS
jgi:hypothetical protein